MIWNWVKKEAFFLLDVGAAFLVLIVVLVGQRQQTGIRYLFLQYGVTFLIVAALFLIRRGKLRWSLFLLPASLVPAVLILWMHGVRW